MDSVARNHPSNCDYFRTSVLFKVPDIYRIVGDSTGFITDRKPEVHNSSYLQYSSLRGMDAYYIKPDDDDLKQAMEVYTAWFDEQLVAAEQANEKQQKVKIPLQSS